MFVEGKSRTVFFPSDTLIYGISRDGSKNYNIRTCEHMILGQLRMGARQTKNAPLEQNKQNTSLRSLGKDEYVAVKPSFTNHDCWLLAPSSSESGLGLGGRSGSTAGPYYPPQPPLRAPETPRLPPKPPHTNPGFPLRGIV